MTRIVAFSVKIRSPIFSIRDVATAEVYASFTLPPPRTMLSLLAKTLGEINKLSSEYSISEIRMSELLMWAIEGSSHAYVKPLSPICKSMQMWRIKSVEKGWLEKVERLSDAVESEIVSTSAIAAYYFIDIDKLDERLKKLERIAECKISFEGLIDYLPYFCQRLGNTECFIHINDKVTTLGIKRKIGKEGKIDTYVPIKWLEGGFIEGVREELYAHLLLSSKQDISFKEFRETRRDKEAFLLPLRRIDRIDGRIPKLIWYEPCKIDVIARDGFSIVELTDGSSMLIPNDFLQQ